MTIEEIIQKIEATSSETGEEIKRQRRSLWQQLDSQVSSENKSDELFTILVSELRILPITVTRWLSGDFAPRRKMMDTVREHLLKRSNRSTDRRRETPVLFSNAHVAIQTLEDSFLSSLRNSKSAFIFKGFSPFRAGSRSDLREIVMTILKEQKELRMYYFYPRDSPAEETWYAFEASLTKLDSSFEGAKNRISGIALTDKDRHMLDFNPASPFVLLYGPDGVAEHGRKVDIWYELPVERVGADGDPVYDRMEDVVTVYSRLPPSISLTLWKTWKDRISQQYHDHIPESDLATIDLTPKIM